MTEPWRLVLPDTFDAYDWAEAAQRGVLLLVFVACGDRRFDAIVVDPHRIVRDAELTLDSEPFYAQNVVLVPEVTENAVRREGDRLSARGTPPRWREPTPADDGQWSLPGAESVDWASIGHEGVLRASLAYGGQRFPVAFFDPAGLAEAVGWGSVEDLLSERAPRTVEFFEQNLVVLLFLSAESVGQAIDHLARKHEFDWMVH